jgi:hypothetical protein
LTSDEPMAVVRSTRSNSPPDKRARLAIKRQIFQTDADQIAEPPADLLEDETGYLIESARRFEALKKLMGGADAHGIDFGDVLAVDAIIQRVGLEPCAPAVGTHEIGAVARQKHAHVHAVALAFERRNQPRMPLYSPSPSMTSCFCLSVSSPQGFFVGTFDARRNQETARAPGAVDPRPDGAVASDFPGSGITRSRSMSITRPKPRQVSQAPSGLLKENRLGTGSR